MLRLQAQGGGVGVDPAKPGADPGEKAHAAPQLVEFLPGQQHFAPGLQHHGAHVGQDLIHLLTVHQPVAAGPEVCGAQPHAGDKGVFLHVPGGQGVVKVIEKGCDGLGRHTGTAFHKRILFPILRQSRTESQFRNFLHICITRSNKFFTAAGSYGIL